MGSGEWNGEGSGRGSGGSRVVVGEGVEGNFGGVGGKIWWEGGKIFTSFLGFGGRLFLFLFYKHCRNNG